MNEKQFEAILDRLDQIIALLEEEEVSEAEGDGDCDPDMLNEALNAIEGQPIPILGEADEEEDVKKLFVV